KGHDVKIADLQFSKPSEIKKHLQEFKPDIFVIYDDGFNYLTKMCLTNMRKAAFEMQQAAKEMNLPVIVSNSDASDHIEKYCNQGADYIILGEAEYTLLELIEAYKNNSEKNNINGIAYLQNGKLIKTLPRPVSKDLDSFPK